jgi:hypothetical protein
MRKEENDTGLQLFYFSAPVFFPHARLHGVTGQHSSHFDSDVAHLSSIFDVHAHRHTGTFVENRSRAEPRHVMVAPANSPIRSVSDVSTADTAAPRTATPRAAPARILSAIMLPSTDIRATRSFPAVLRHHLRVWRISGPAKLGMCMHYANKPST